MTYQHHTALLIDAENTPIGKLTTFLEKWRPFDREITLKRAYGNWSNPCLKNWEPVLRTHAVRPVQMFDCATGKNAADIALAVDAMELLHTGQYDAFIIMSSDSDYTPLVMKLREAGVRVMGIGKDDAPEAYRSACTNYLCLHNIYSEEPGSFQALLKNCGFCDEEDGDSTEHCGLIDDDLLDTSFLLEEEEPADEPDCSAEEKASIWDSLFEEDDEPEAAPAGIVWGSIDDLLHELDEPAEAAESTEEEFVWDTLDGFFPEVVHLENTAEMRSVHKLLHIAYDCCKGENGYALLSSTGSFIKEIRPEFDYRDYGFRQLHELLLACPEQYQVITYPAGAKAKVMAFRCRA